MLPLYSTYEKIDNTIAGWVIYDPRIFIEEKKLSDGDKNGKNIQHAFSDKLRCQVDDHSTDSKVQT